MIDPAVQPAGRAHGVVEQSNFGEFTVARITGKPLRQLPFNLA